MLFTKMAFVGSGYMARWPQKKIEKYTTRKVTGPKKKGNLVRESLCKSGHVLYMLSSG